MNRISFFHRLAIENGEITGVQFSQVDPQPGVLVPGTGNYVVTGYAAGLVVGIPAASLKAELEQMSPPGEEHFGLFRSARQSTSPVEEFMHLYHILLMVFSDSQRDVDAFVVGEDPTVPQTQRPRKEAGFMETVYTRLRNELAHKRVGARDAAPSERPRDSERGHTAPCWATIRLWASFSPPSSLWPSPPRRSPRTTPSSTNSSSPYP